MFESIYLIQIRAPAGLPNLPDADWDPLEDWSKRVGASLLKRDCRSVQAFRDCVRELAASRPGAVLAVVCAHGRHKSIRGGEPRNLLLAGDTDLEDILATSVDLDETITTLRSQRPDPTLIVVDACEVDLRGHLGASAGQGSAVVLLANPGATAASSSRGGLLSQAFQRSLATPSERARTLRSVVQETITAVMRDSSQHPRLAEFGSVAFLDALEPPRRGPTTSHSRVASVLVALALEGALSKEALRRLSEVPGDGGERDEVVTACLAALRPFDDERRQALRSLVESATLSPRTQAYGLHTLGWSCWRRGENSGWTFGDAEGWLAAALKVAREVGDRSLESQILNTLGYLHRERLSFKAAHEHFEASLAQKTELGDQTGIQMSRLALGWLLFARGKLEEGREHFRNAARDASDSVRALLEQGSKQDYLLSAIRSLVFHLAGAVTGELLCDPTAEDENRVQLFLDVDDHVSKLDWIAQATRWPVLGELRLLLALWRRDDTDLRRHLGAGDGDPDGELVKAVRLAACALRDGEGVLTNEACAEYVERLDASPLDLRIKLLAISNALANRLDSELALKLRDDILRRLRSLGFDGIPSVGSPPWRPAPPAGVTVDTSRWSCWGPLAVQVGHLKRPRVFISNVATSHCLQLVGWVSALVLALEGGLHRRDVFREMAAICPEGSTVTIGLSQALALATRIAARTTPRSETGRRLRELWHEGSVLKRGGYDRGVEDLASERNRLEHVHLTNVKQIQAIVARHAGILAEIGVAIDATDVLEPTRGREATFRDQRFADARLTNSRGDHFNCGPLLVIERDESPEFFVPHRIRKYDTLAKTRKSEYIRYSATTTELAGRQYVCFEDREWTEAFKRTSEGEPDEE